LVTSPRSSRSRAGRKRDGNNTCSVPRRERCALLSDFKTLLLPLLPMPDSGAATVCGRELNRAVRRSRGEGRLVFGILHEPYILGRSYGRDLLALVHACISLCDI
jgi:hypothetical protein